jgi:hypothetical protein
MWIRNVRASRHWISLFEGMSDPGLRAHLITDSPAVLAAVQTKFTDNRAFSRLWRFDAAVRMPLGFMTRTKGSVTWQVFRTTSG